MTPNRIKPPGHRSDGFTLVETVLAVGIVATGLLAIIATAGTTLERLASLANRDAALRLRSTLVATFQDSARFPELYAAVRDETPIYAYCFGGDSEGENIPVDATQTESFELADHHINRVRISTDEKFAAELAASPFVFRIQFEFFDVMTGEQITPSNLPADPGELSALRLPAVVNLFWINSERVENGDHSISGRPVTTFNTVLKP